MNETARSRPCCANCVFFHQESVGIVDWEHNEQVTWNFCVLEDFDLREGEIIVRGDGERNAAGLCSLHEAI